MAPPKGRGARQHLVANDPQRVQVAPAVEVFARGLFGTHVRRCTHYGTRARVASTALDESGDAEVGEQRTRFG